MNPWDPFPPNIPYALSIDPNNTAPPPRIQDPYYDQSMAFLKALLEKGYDGEGAMIWETKWRIKDVFKKLENAPRAPTEEDKRVLTSFQEDMVKRVEDDKKYAAAQAKLKALQRDVWLLRYADYFSADDIVLRTEAIELKREIEKVQKEVRDQANNVPTSATVSAPGPIGSVEETLGSQTPLPAMHDIVLSEFCTLSWKEIQDRFDEEKHKPDPEKHMTNLVTKLTGSGHERNRGYFTRIEKYVHSGDMAHLLSQILRLAGARVWRQLASHMAKHLQDLMFESRINEEDRTVARVVVMANIGLFFQEIKVRGLTGVCFGYTKRPTTADGEIDCSGGECEFVWV